jgi:DNA-binding transcriptional ArsR family regulator
MAEENEEVKEPGVRVLTPDEDDARTVAKAMASSTAGEILKSFQGQERSASYIASALHLPISTVMYHLDALLEAGFIEVSRIRYSVKGREVKVYRQSDQVFIVAPTHADLRAALLRYASLFGITIFGAGVAAFLLQVRSAGLPEVGPVLGEMKEKSEQAVVLYSPGEWASDTISAGSSFLPPSPDLVHKTGIIPEIAMGILIGGCLVIGLLLCLDLISWKRNR